MLNYSVAELRINKVYNSNKTLIFAEISLLTENKHKV